jgi:hypothetical protein
MFRKPTTPSPRYPAPRPAASVHVWDDCDDTARAVPVTDIDSFGYFSATPAATR